ncbi:hypothetical protein CFC21_044932 [Triticum aestivum]|uniref:PGG domain-containing protein n=2 Tax=Triticum aestivum TaxID=4565 RepID=A0A9R1FRJ0_WHEAT|nr:hypothetical protein CFC21_044932 [Triticum aestivum]CDM87066.1 unnamed protein product [Triticum aestivum]
MATGAIEDMEFLWRWRKYLLLFAMLVASVTYGAGLNPPGGVRSEDGGNASEHRTDGVGVDPPLPPPPPAVYPFLVGDPLLASTYSRQYTAFFYCNAAAFVLSLVIIMLLLDRRLSQNRVGLTVLRSAMLLDLLALMAAFAAGSCCDVVASIYVSGLFALVFAYVALHLCVSTSRADSHLEEQRRRYPLLLATFATPLTYSAGLTPPGGFWSKTVAGHHTGDPLLHDGSYKIGYQAFFYANAISFVASLAMAMMAMSPTLSGRLVRSYALPVCILVELLGLMAAYATGSCRWPTSTVYVFSLGGAVLLYIVLQMVVATCAMETLKQLRGTVCRILSCADRPEEEEEGEGEEEEEEEEEEGEGEGEGTSRCSIVDGYNVEAEAKVDESRALLLLLATLAATVTYQAGLSPPGGVWPDNNDQGHPHHIAGNPVLLDMHPKRYKAFYYCNTWAFVASLVIIIILQSKELSSAANIRRAALKTAMVLELFGLMGAYVAGGCRDTTTSIYVFVVAIAMFVYSIAMVMVYTAHGQSRLMKWVHRMSDKLGGVFHLHSRYGSESGAQDDNRLERKRQFLLQLSSLAATVTYQIGLNPPGGFWTESDRDRSVTAGDPVLLDHYVLGSCRQLRTSIYVLALVAAVVAFLVLHFILLVSAGHWSLLQWLPQQLKRLFEPLPVLQLANENQRNVLSLSGKQQHRKLMRLMVLGVLAATVTYQSGLTPPGGTWGDDNDTGSSWSPSAYPLIVAGNPILMDTNPERYQAFFYCNSTSFMASIVVIMLVLQHAVMRRGMPLWVMQTAVVLDLLGLLGAYTAGSCRDWETSACVMGLIAAVVVFITIYAVLSKKKIISWKCLGENHSDDVQFSRNV